MADPIPTNYSGADWTAPEISRWIFHQNWRTEALYGLGINQEAIDGVQPLPALWTLPNAALLGLEAPTPLGTGDVGPAPRPVQPTAGANGEYMGLRAPTPYDTY